MKNKYKNLWWKSCGTPRPEFYENDAPKVAEHRGVEVFKTHSRGFDFVIEGACISQRAGFSAGISVIDDILDGRDYVADQVADHLEALGFSPKRYPSDNGTGDNPVRYARLTGTTRAARKVQFDAQLEQFTADAKAGKLICLSDLIGNAESFVS